MGIFDTLIDLGKKPKVGMEYIYNFRMVWPLIPDSPKLEDHSMDVEEGIIVTDVVATGNEEGWHTGYDFTIKETGRRCHCNYPWAFWENTPENLKKIERYKVEKGTLDMQQRIVDGVYKKIDNLES